MLKSRVDEGGFRGVGMRFEGPNDERPKEPLSYLSWAGIATFSHAGTKFTFKQLQPQSDLEAAAHRARERRYLQDMQATQFDLEITCISPFRQPGRVMAFLEHIRTLHLQDLADTQSSTTIFRPQYGSASRSWEVISTRPKRPLASVKMNAKEKIDIVSDMKGYLTDEARRWYAERGIPWRRGYLLHGPPGTGKTSFCMALAGAQSLAVYTIDISNPKLNDNSLAHLFNDMPERSMVLLEDLDCAGLSREQPMTERDQSGKDIRVSKGVTLSGLLNVIDGPAAPEGRLLIITTNKPERLDKALLRPGRIDRQIYFGNASQEVIVDLFFANVYQGARRRHIRFEGSGHRIRSKHSIRPADAS